ncbi:TasA family protein [Thermococcus sp.]|uniref:TasA family protein n=1 Tax=Thermococcus sp. TaxID=35749 RepID=UPI0025EB59AD|nr:TasA family protein [Thermococcus sp.]
MKGALLSLVLVGMVVMGLGAGTWAYFSDTETSSGNYIMAGTLDLSVNGAGSVTQSVDGDGVAPGDSGSWTIAVSNDGTVDGHLYVTISNVNPAENTPNSVDSGTWSIENAVILTIYDTSGNPVITDTLANLEGQQLDLGSLTAGQSVNIQVDWEIDSNADNGIQGDSVTFDMDFLLEQS